MVGLIAFARLDNFVIGPRVYESKIKANYQTFGTVTNPAAVTMSIGLTADAHAVMVFAMPLRQFYNDWINPARLSGLCHLDKFVWTRKLLPVNRDFAKTKPNPFLE